MLGLVFALGLGLGVSALRAEDQEEKVSLDQVPKAVMDAGKARFAGAEIKGASKEEEDGKTFYELTLDHNAQKTDVLARADGTIVEIERQIDPGALPAPVAAGVQAKYPRARIQKAEEKTEGTKVSYEVVIETAKKSKREIALDRQGKILEDEEFEDED
jgi:uncharacterized membrane protein YkoI